MEHWSLKHTNPGADWPRDAAGEPVPPVFLEHITGSELELELELSLFRAYEIPVLLQYPNDGDFGRLILGFSGTGADLYVPETLLEDAMNIMSGDISPDDEEELQ